MPGRVPGFHWRVGGTARRGQLSAALYPCRSGSGAYPVRRRRKLRRRLPLPREPNCLPPCTHAVRVGVHPRCTAGEIFGADCHCREILDESLRMIAEEGCGALIYLHNTSRGFEIDHKPAEPEPYHSAFEAGG